MGGYAKRASRQCGRDADFPLLIAVRERHHFRVAYPSRILEQLTGDGLPGHVDRALAMARYPYRVTGPFAYTLSFVLIVASRPHHVP
jgi:hypothetical protein